MAAMADKAVALSYYPARISAGNFMQHSLETRRKRLRYRTSHTGTRETDILLGGFVAAHGDSLDHEATGALEDLLDGANDREILDWITGREALPERFRGATMARLLDYVRERAIS
ncbi:MAG: succinate dehydrogenase assembly factor 2 [Alphaproteobacteria bacterium]|jgi:antitoxin CptB|nr:succinate dehydrogenase assembly factor 2 [Alphaproteobacteria bacterium]|tara:strand:+ start:1412 stop:1756 length:345 start_codon:yes stop_codon:yes gene_type:complete